MQCVLGPGAIVSLLFSYLFFPPASHFQACFRLESVFHTSSEGKLRKNAHLCMCSYLKWGAGMVDYTGTECQFCHDEMESRIHTESPFCYFMAGGKSVWELFQAHQNGEICNRIWRGENFRASLLCMCFACRIRLIQSPSKIIELC